MRFAADIPEQGQEPVQAQRGRRRRCFRLAAEFHREMFVDRHTAIAGVLCHGERFARGVSSRIGQFFREGKAIGRRRAGTHTGSSVSPDTTVLRGAVGDSRWGEHAGAAGAAALGRAVRHALS